MRNHADAEVAESMPRSAVHSVRKFAKVCFANHSYMPGPAANRRFDSESTGASFAQGDDWSADKLATLNIGLKCVQDLQTSVVSIVAIMWPYTCINDVVAVAVESFRLDN